MSVGDKIYLSDLVGTDGYRYRPILQKSKEAFAHSNSSYISEYLTARYSEYYESGFVYKDYTILVNGVHIYVIDTLDVTNGKNITLDTSGNMLGVDETYAYFYVYDGTVYPKGSVIRLKLEDLINTGFTSYQFKKAPSEDCCKLSTEVWSPSNGFGGGLALFRSSSNIARLVIVDLSTMTEKSLFGTGSANIDLMFADETYIYISTTEKNGIQLYNKKTYSYCGLYSFYDSTLNPGSSKVYGKRMIKAANGELYVLINVSSNYYITRIVNGSPVKTVSTANIYKMKLIGNYLMTYGPSYLYRMSRDLSSSYQMIASGDGMSMVDEDKMKRLLVAVVGTALYTYNEDKEYSIANYLRV